LVGVEKLRTIKTCRFYGRVLFGCESYRFTSEKLFETKTLVLVFKVDFNPKPRFGVEKLRTIKTARFCGRVLFGCESIRFTSKKLFETKTLVLVFKVDFNPKPWFGVEKLLNDKI